ncbi:hypothetical protein ACYZTL_06540 [Pseudomonas sp. LB3P81]
MLEFSGSYSTPLGYNADASIKADGNEGIAIAIGFAFIAIGVGVSFLSVSYKYYKAQKVGDGGV